MGCTPKSNHDRYSAVQLAALHPGIVETIFAFVTDWRREVEKFLTRLASPVSCESPFGCVGKRPEAGSMRSRLAVSSRALGNAYLKRGMGDGEASEAATSP